MYTPKKSTPRFVLATGEPSKILQLTFAAAISSSSLSTAHGAILQLKCLAEQRCVTDGPGKSHPGSRSKICDDICFALVDEADDLAVSNGNMESDSVANT